MFHSSYRQLFTKLQFSFFKKEHDKGMIKFTIGVSQNWMNFPPGGVL